jgi:uncharacterized membrane protein YuzA (DUF378 family)
MKALHLNTVAMVLLIIGGLNAGISAAFDVDVINKVIGSGNVSTVLYVLVGLSAVYMLAERAGIMGEEA